MTSNNSMLQPASLRDPAPSASALRVLVADDDPATRMLLRHYLSSSGFEVLEAVDGLDLSNKMQPDIDLVLLDLQMPERSGMDCLRFLQNDFRHVPVIVISGTSVDDGIRTIKEGAFWFLHKPLDQTTVLKTTQAALTHVRDNRRLPPLQQLPLPLQGESVAIREVRTAARNITALNPRVLILGESGTGKSSLARYIHSALNRDERDFIIIPCATVTKELLLERLTVAKCAEGAQSLLFDEIGQLPLELQSELGVFLEEVAEAHARSTHSKHFSGVFVSSISEPAALCRQGTLSEQLYYRLPSPVITMPPLRSRSEDIPQLVSLLLRQIHQRRGAGVTSIGQEAVKTLKHYYWPGNIRELESVLEHASAFCREKLITVADLQIKSAKFHGTVEDYVFAGLPLSEIERRAILYTLELCKGNRSNAARRLGISERSIYNKLKTYGLIKETQRDQPKD